LSSDGGPRRRDTEPTADWLTLAALAVNLHVEAPMTLARMQARHRWLVPAAAALFLSLAIGAWLQVLVWDGPITNAAVNARTSGLDWFFLRVSRMGSTPVVLLVSTVAAGLAWRRCPRLAIAIVVIAFARPLAEWSLKELVARDRPIGDQLVTGDGHSFPSGHPFATAASWGVLPLVAALYTRRRLLWWCVAVSVWLLVAGVAVSRVWLGVHWTSDVVAGLVLAVLGVAVAERFVRATHEGRSPCPQMAQRARSDSRLTTSRSA
jgi:membrane-associated phospholipid phosphatase